MDWLVFKARNQCKRNVQEEHIYNSQENSIVSLLVLANRAIIGVPEDIFARTIRFSHIEFAFNYNSGKQTKLISPSNIPKINI